MQTQHIKAYSYIRLSSERQLKGDGETRQIEMRDAFLAEHGLDLDETLRDLGISAFDGSNREKGALGVFLRKVEAGEVPRGSYLLVESLDRLSRAHVLKALRMFLDIIEAGIVVATLGDGFVYSEERINENWTQLIVSLAIMSRAHEESARKAQRLRGVWARKRANRERKLTARCPSWLTLLPDQKTFDPIPKRVEIIKRMLEELASGIGRDKIARRLNAERIKPWGHGREWHGGTVTKFTDNAALIGRYQPCTVTREAVDGVMRERRTPIGEPIEDYYPRVVSDDLWQRARRASDKRARQGKGNSGGRKGTVYSNLFSGRIVCDSCEQAMNYRDRGPRSTPCLRCSGNRNGTCDNGAKPRYLPLERVLLSWALLSDRGPSTPDDPANERLAVVERQRDEAAAVVERLVAAIERGEALTDRLALRQIELAQAEEDLTAARQEDRAAIRMSSTEQRRGILAAAVDAQDPTEPERYAIRAAAAQELRDLISEIRCHVDGSVTVWRGLWGFRVRFSDNEAWIEGGCETGRETIVAQWETRSGTVVGPFFPPLPVA